MWIAHCVDRKSFVSTIERGANAASGLLMMLFVAALLISLVSCVLHVNSHETHAQTPLVVGERCKCGFVWELCINDYLNRIGTAEQTCTNQ